MQHTLYVFSVTHGLRLLFQLLLFVRQQLCLGQFLLLEAQEILVITVAANLFTKLVELSYGSTKFVIRSLIVSHLNLIACHDVHNIKLEVLLTKEKILVLAVHIDELFAKLAHRGKRNGSVIDERPTLSACVNLTAQKTLLRIVVEVVVHKEILQHIGVIDTQVEGGFNDTLVASSLHLSDVSPVAKQEADGTDDDALSCSCLSGNDGETGIELHGQMTDERKVSYVKYL